MRVPVSPNAFRSEVEARGHYCGSLVWQVKQLDMVVPAGDAACFQATVAFCYASSHPSARRRQFYTTRLAEATDLSDGLVAGIFKGCAFAGPDSIFAGGSPVPPPPLFPHVSISGEDRSLLPWSPMP